MTPDSCMLKESYLNVKRPLNTCRYEKNLLILSVKEEETSMMLGRMYEEHKFRRVFSWEPVNVFFMSVCGAFRNKSNCKGSQMKGYFCIGRCMWCLFFKMFSCLFWYVCKIFSAAAFLEFVVFDVCLFVFNILRAPSCSELPVVYALWALTYAIYFKALYFYTFTKLLTERTMSLTRKVMPLIGE